jgi:hypothetical protein
MYNYGKISKFAALLNEREREDCMLMPVRSLIYFTPRYNAKLINRV